MPVVQAMWTPAGDHIYLSLQYKDRRKGGQVYYAVEAV